MEHRISYAAIGAFVLVLGAVLAALLIWLAAGGTRENYNDYAIYLKSGAESLSANSQVYYHGIPAGHVISVSLDPKHPLSAQVLIGVREDIPLRADTKAEIRSRLTGPSYIELNGGSRAAPLLVAQPGEEYPIIAAQPGTLDLLTNSARHIAERLDKVSARLEKVLSEENIVSITDSLSNIRKFSANLADYSGKLGNAVSNLDAILANARKASVHLPAMVTKVQQTLGDYQALSQRLDGTARSVTRAANRLGDLTPNAQGLLSQLDRVTENLNALVQQLSRNPNSVILGRAVHPGPGEKGQSGG